MKDIILWDISIGNGYCRRRFSCTVTVAVAVTISLKSFFSSFFAFVYGASRGVSCIHFFWLASEGEREWEKEGEKEEGEERGREITSEHFILVEGDKIGEWISEMLCFVSMRKCAANTRLDAELLMPLVLVKYCNVPLKQHRVFFLSHLFASI